MKAVVQRVMKASVNGKALNYKNICLKFVRLRE
jgi:hypothetical protein